MYVYILRVIYAIYQRTLHCVPIHRHCSCTTHRVGRSLITVKSSHGVSVATYTGTRLSRTRLFARLGRYIAHALNARRNKPFYAAHAAKCSQMCIYLHLPSHLVVACAFARFSTLAPDQHATLARRQGRTSPWATRSRQYSHCDVRIGYGYIAALTSVQRGRRLKSDSILHEIIWRTSLH